MIKSMTGYGRGSAEAEGRSFTVEIKSVNNRYSDINIRLPRVMNPFEDSIRKYIASKVNRGKIDVYITQEKIGENDFNITVDEQVAKSYYDAYNSLKEMFSIKDDISLSLLSRSNDVIVVEKKEEDIEAIWKVLSQALEQAVDMFVDMRISEGQKLKSDILERSRLIGGMVLEIEERSPEVVKEYREKILQRVTEILKDVEVDQAKLLNEVAFFADRSSITEELVRLKSHIGQLEHSLSSNEPVGRKLDFIIQEMNREVNTIGSKANDLMITNTVLEMKSEVEKIREQVQNIE